jgi:hypothetical protein
VGEVIAEMQIAHDGAGLRGSFWQFANPNDMAPDPVNGFGGRGWDARAGDDVHGGPADRYASEQLPAPGNRPFGHRAGRTFSDALPLIIE